MDMSRNVEFHEFFIKWIPVTITQWWSFHAAAFAGIGIQQGTDESHFPDAFFQIGKYCLWTHTRTLWQAANAAKDFREKSDLVGNDIVRFLRVPRYELRRFAVHHLIWT